MVQSSVFLQRIIIVFFGVQECYATMSPQLHLWSGQNFDMMHTIIQSSTPNLSTKDFDNQANSFYLHGTVILYDNINYNDENPDKGIITMTHTSTQWLQGTSATVSTLPTTSSVRILGGNSGSNHYPSIILFAKNNFGGLQAEHIAQSFPVLSYSNAVSLINIGINSWTFYDEDNYKGTGHCVKGSSDLHGVRFLPNSTAIGFSIYGKRSVKLGCLV